MSDSPQLSWSQAWHPRHLLDVSSLILLAANLIPLVGVLFWGWDLFLLMMLYWMETAIIGFWHILRMAIEVKWFALFLVPFFCVHFGGFMSVHLVFLVVLFGKGWSAKIHGAGDFIDQILLGTKLWIPFVALFISHGISFFLNYVKPRLDPPPDPGLAAPTPGSPQVPAWVAPLQSLGNGDLMTAPYKRVVIMHVTIIFGGILSMVLHMDKAAFVFMVVLKTFIDLGSHAKKNFKPLSKAGEAP